MIDFVGTSRFIKKRNGLPRQPCIFTKPKLVILWEIYFSHSGCLRAQFCASSKLSLECKVGQIRSWGIWFGVEISLFMMFVYVSTLFISLSLIFLSMQIRQFRIPPLY